MSPIHLVQVYVAELADTRGARVYIGWAPGIRPEDQRVNALLLEPAPTLEALLDPIGERIIVDTPGLDPYRAPSFYPLQHLRTMLGRYEVTDPERVTTELADLRLLHGTMMLGGHERSPGRSRAFHG